MSRFSGVVQDFVTVQIKEIFEEGGGVKKVIFV